MKKIVILFTIITALTTNTQAMIPEFFENNGTLVDKRLKKTAEDDGYGYKTANLIELNKELNKWFKNDTELTYMLKSLNVAINIPKCIGISSASIQKYLENNKFNLKCAWSEIIKKTLNQETMKNAMINKKLPSEFIVAIKKLGADIKEFFNSQAEMSEHENCLKFCLSDISLINDMSPFLEQRKKADQKIIVRSTGGSEDKKDIANAGGNKSIKFVEPTFSASLRAMGKVIASYFSPRSLTQRLVAEDKTIFDLPLTPILLQVMVTAKKQPIECVVHTTEQYGSTKGILSLNYGYGVVASSQRAHLGFLSHFANQGHYILAKNVAYLPEEPCMAIRAIATRIEKHYQQPMDIELLVTFHPENFYEISIVQVRPLKCFETAKKASYIENIGIIKKQMAEKNIGLATTIVPAGASVRHIKSSKQIIVAQTLSDALRYYLYSNINKSEVQAVIVKGNAEPNSHEATTFANHGKLVMVASKSYDMIDFLESKSELNLYLDAQQGFIINPGNITINIKDGYITHPMPLQVTIQDEKPIKLTFEIKDSMPTSDISTLVSTAKKGSQEEATMALSSLLARINKEIDTINIDTISTTSVTKIIAQDAVKKLEHIKQFAVKKVVDILPFLNKPSNDLQRLAAIKPVEALLHQQKDKQLIKTYSYNSIIEKFKQRKTFIIEQILPECNKSGMSLDILNNLYLLDIARNGYDAAINANLEKQWITFVGEIAKEKSFIDPFCNMMRRIKDLNVFAMWLHTSFYERAKSSNAKTILEETCKEIEESENFLRILQDKRTSLDSINANNWGNPQKVPGLLTKIENDFLTYLKSDDFLNVFSASNNSVVLFKRRVALSFMSYFIETFDNTFGKIFKTSTQYGSEKQKVNHFKRYVKDYLDLLGAWFTFFDYSDKEIDEKSFQKNANQYAKNILKYLSMCTDQEKELLPSPKFNVQAIIFPRSIINYASKQNLNDSFIGIAIPKTLEDLYTSAHQNILVFLNYHMLKSGLNNIEKPSSVAAIEKKILTNGTTLIGIIIQPGIVTYTYNKPLRVHGATFRIRYSKKDKKTFFEIEIPKDRLCGEEDCVTFVLESKETFLKTNTSLQECIIDESEIIFRLEITDNTNVNDLLESAVGKKWAVF